MAYLSTEHARLQTSKDLLHINIPSKAKDNNNAVYLQSLTLNKIPYKLEWNIVDTVPAY